MKSLKRTLLTGLFVLTLSVQTLTAAGYHLYTNITASPQFSAVEKDPIPVRSRMNLGVDLGVASLRISPKQIITLPISVNWSSHTNTKPVDFLTNHLDFIVSLGYQYDFTDLLALRGTLGGGVRIYPDLSAWAPVYSQINLELLVTPLDSLAVIFPVRAVITDMQADFSVGVGVSYFIDFVKETEHIDPDDELFEEAAEE